MKKWEQIISECLDVAPILTLRTAALVFPGSNLRGGSVGQTLVVYKDNIPLSEDDNQRLWEAIDKDIPATPKVRSNW